MATRKPQVAADEKLENTDIDLFEVLDALDRKDYGYYARLTEEQQRKVTPHLLVHWMSAIKSSGELGAYYVMNTDAAANKHLYNENVSQHPALQWLMLCAISPGIGKQFHQWLPHLSMKFGLLKEKATNKPVAEYFKKVYPREGAAVINELTSAYVTEQNHKMRLSEMYPEMKVSDIEALSKVVSSEELDQYDRDSGN